ncbi:hypothetical protein DPMN_066451 [Dreissena polymorpha]|uniref:Uncharacterized protein n=1 Tax=Dreissena polymorpha TaxID=45954 RepID=A0A9D4BKI1_DREPO|nr:hypothetical protein DPMN_066451 [Dreissena polymorpha]
MRFKVLWRMLSQNNTSETFQISIRLKSVTANAEPAQHSSATFQIRIRFKGVKLTAEPAQHFSATFQISIRFKSVSRMLSQLNTLA